MSITGIMAAHMTVTTTATVTSSIQGILPGKGTGSGAMIGTRTESVQEAVPIVPLVRFVAQLAN